MVVRVERIAEVRADPAASRSAISAGLVAVREAQAWLDAQHAGLVTRLRDVDSFPEKTIADAAKTSLGQATKTTERSATLGATPRLAGALDDGRVTAGHIDAVTRTSKRLDPGQRQALFDRADALTAVAANATVDEFAKRLDLEATRLDDSNGEARLDRQRRAARVRTWTDPDGMWNLNARLDPLTGIKMAARLDTTVEALFAEAEPEGCPTDPIEKQRYLTAQALSRLLLDPNTATRPGRGEFVAVIDADAPHQPGPVAEFAIPVELPARVIAELADNADITAVVVRNGVVLYAPGELNLGRTTRLANRAQRRALRALYACCSIPGCSVAYDRCKLHHIIWWINGGTTDLDNLLPVCTVHHTKIHHDDWVIELGPNRELTLTLPDGTTHTTGPPSRHPHRRTAA